MWANNAAGYTVSSEISGTVGADAMSSLLGKPPTSKSGNGFTITVSAGGDVTGAVN